MTEYNSQAFTPEEVEQGLVQDLINYLLDYNKKCESGYYDIHITSDGYCTIVEWLDINWDFKGEEGKFEFLNSDELIYKEVHLPDDTYVYVEKQEAEKTLDDWLKEHPGWEKDEWGRWRNYKEEEQLYGKLIEELPEDDCSVLAH